MRYAPSPVGRQLIVLSFLLALGACAYAIPEVSPADIPRIEEELATDPENTDLQVQLGMARFKADNYDAALDALQGAVDAGNESGPALLYLGMVQEEFENWSEANDAYSRYLSVGRSEPLKAELRKRLQLIGQNLLRQQAVEALAQEAQLGDADVTPRSVAVFPFAFNSTRDDLEPLIYALSDMMVTDFKVSNALVVLERAQIQTLLDEIGLTEAGYSEPATGARAGRLLQAEHVIQGVLTTLGDENLSIATDVLNVPSSSSVGQVSQSNTLQNLFDMEKALVFETIRDVLGVQLTPAEEQAILDNRTDNVLAFLAYGRGLRQRDQGNYVGAQAEFEQAQELDPDFEAATTATNETSDIQDAAGTTTSDIAQTAAVSGETSSGSNVAPPTSATTGGTGGTGGGASGTGASGTLSGASEAVNPSPTASTLDLGSTDQSDNQTQQATSENRDPVQESQGQESVSSTAQAQIRIVIKRPGGGDEQ